MYEEYYGFVQPPFNLTPDPRFLYRSASHDLALQELVQAINRREGFIILTGDIGTGKTTLCRTLLEELNRRTFTALILNPFLKVEELLREVLLSFGVVSKDALRSGRLATASKHELVRTLHEFLGSLVPIGANAVMVIDEAQHLSADVLEEIRILSNLETERQKLVQIVIVGQLNLLDVLRSAKPRQLNQRISIRCSLQPLDREEVEAYVTHRLMVARGATNVTFTRAALNLLHELSAGVPRLINLICDRTLMAGAEARTATLNDGLVAKGATALGLDVPERAGLRARVMSSVMRVPRAAAVTLALVPIFGAAAFLAFAGNPLTLMVSADLPSPPARAAPALPVPLASVPADAALDAEPPPYASGPFSVLVGTFAEPRYARQAEVQLKEQGLPVYTVDVIFSEGDVRRRILLGRYTTRGQALAAIRKLGSEFEGALVIFGWQERMRRPDLSLLS
jgi:general secretion pathway protein A